MDTCHLFLPPQCQLSLPLNKVHVHIRYVQFQGRSNMRIVEQRAIEDFQTVPLKALRKTRWTKKRNVLIVVLIFLLLASSISIVAGYLGYQKYRTDLMLAQTGEHYLQMATASIQAIQQDPLN